MHQPVGAVISLKRMSVFSITFAETCLVFLVYEDDTCRGEQEKDENTLDAVSPLPPAEPSTTT